MPVVEFLKRLGAGLLALGARRLAALGLAGVTVFTLIVASGYFLSRPTREVLYSALGAEDVSRIGTALTEAGIGFDVNAANDTVLVEYGEAPRARMILAQKGLPKGGSAGYELFDKLGSLGLTSFMQQVTKVRALEGELARSIQQFDGIKAARVHIALRAGGSFLDDRQPATASVVIRTERRDMEASTGAIRHLVAAAIPGLTPDQVAVMTTDGRLLTSSEGPLSETPERLIGLEHGLSDDIEQRIVRTLTPYLGIDNFRITASAKLNADKRQTSETSYDPNSRVERSVRSIKESGEASNANAAQPVSVDQNVPQEDRPAAGGDSSKEKKDRREEITNYELNTKSVAVTSEGYGIDRISIAVVVNRLQLMKSLGDAASDAAVAGQVAEIEKLVRSAAGLVDARGDTIKVTALDFLDRSVELEPVETAGLMEILAGNLGSVVNGAILVVVVLLVLFLGLRPALRIISETGMARAAIPQPGAAPNALPLPDSSQIGGNLSLADPVMAQRIGTADRDSLIDDLARQVSNGPQERLMKIVALDPDRAADVLRHWMVASPEAHT